MSSSYFKFLNLNDKFNDNIAVSLVPNSSGRTMYGTMKSLTQDHPESWDCDGSISFVTHS